MFAWIPFSFSNIFVSNWPIILTPFPFDVISYFFANSSIDFFTSCNSSFRFSRLTKSLLSYPFVILPLGYNTFVGSLCTLKSSGKLGFLFRLLQNPQVVRTMIFISESNSNIYSQPSLNGSLLIPPKISSAAMKISSAFCNSANLILLAQATLCNQSSL